jgi:membrane protease YdiL (CAAX protease family)
MYMGSLSLSYVLFIGLVGLFFSWCVKRTGSIWGVVLAHSLLI